MLFVVGCFAGLLPIALPSTLVVGQQDMHTYIYIYVQICIWRRGISRIMDKGLPRFVVQHDILRQHCQKPCSSNYRLSQNIAVPKLQKLEFSYELVST